MAQSPDESTTKSAAKPAAELASSCYDSSVLEMRIPARAEWVRVVRLATAGVAGRAGFAYDDIEDIKLAIAEACNNAILHSGGALDSDADGVGSTPDSNQAVVTIRWQVLKTGIRISVSDEGRLDPPGLPRRAGSTPKARPVGELRLSELPESGMGLLLIESLMDKVEHESGVHADTTLHMTKYVPPEKAATENSVAPKPSASTKMKPDPDSPVALGAPRNSR